MHVLKSRMLLPVFLWYTALFAVLRIFTLHSDYIEGDAAATILYHLCGRDAAIQPPYAAYHSGLDFILEHSGIQGEAALRQFALEISFWSGWLVLILLVTLLEHLLENTGTLKHRRWFYILIPILIPDFLFHSLIINPVNLSFVFSLGGLLLLWRYLNSGSLALLALSAVLVALAVPLRWTAITVYPVYAALFLYAAILNGRPFFQKHILPVALSCVCAVVLAFVFIAVTGYNPAAVLHMVSSGGQYLEQQEYSVLTLLAGGSAFFTPGFALLLLLGIGYLTQKETRKPALAFAALLLCCCVPFVILGFFPYFKFSMSLLPVLLLLAFYGFFSLRGLWRPALITAAFLPWLIGIRITADGTFCGPGFEMGITQTQRGLQQLGRENPDSRLRIRQVAPVFSGGFYLPMAEGPRPLYGYAYVLFGGQWYDQAEAFYNERRQMLDFLQKQPKATYWQDRPKSFFACDLYQLGYQTRDAYDKDLRIFTRKSDSIVIRLTQNPADLNSVRQQLTQAGTPFVFRSTYSSDIMKMAAMQPDATVLGPFTLIQP